MTESRPAMAIAAPIANVGAMQPRQALLLPLCFILVLFGFGWLPAAEQNSHLQWSFWGGAAVLGIGAVALLASASLRGRELNLEIVLRSQHYVQACAQLSVYVYWGWYWREVYHSVELFAAQLLFAYAFDALLNWARRDDYVLGFGPFPIVFSTNLFLWFKPDWFYLQFVMLALGFAAKELIRWNKDGRRTHVFNPSSFPLAVCSLILLATGTTHLTWGAEIAITQMFPPYIYVLIFVAALPGQYLFGVTLMTMSAAATSFAFSLAYVAATGSDWYGQTYIPIASFLGMHLLFTDPSTSPRTELGRVLFGVFYGASIAALYGLLEAYGQPSFYDKLLAVPILNLLIQVIDRFASSRAAQRIDPTALLSGLAPRRRYLVYISLWACIFLVMQAMSSDGRSVVRHRKLGVVRFNEGKLSEAIEHFRALTQIDNGDRDGLGRVGLAMALQARGQLEEAAEHFRLALRNNPELGTAHYELGRLYRQKGEPRSAIEHLEQALALEPDDWQLHYEMGLARAATDDAQAAAVHFARVGELQPDRPDLQVDLARQLMRLHRPAAAAEHLERAIALEPRDVTSTAQLAWLYATSPEVDVRDGDRALELAHRLGKLSRQQDPQALDILAAAHAERGDYLRAARLATDALEQLESAPPGIRDAVRNRLQLYREGRPYRDTR